MKRIGGGERNFPPTSSCVIFTLQKMKSFYARQAFGRDLNAAFPEIGEDRPRTGAEDKRSERYTGVTLITKPRSKYDG